MRLIIFLSVFIICITIVYTVGDGKQFSDNIIAVIISVIAGILVIFVDNSLAFGKNFYLSTLCYTRYHNKYIRFSISYLFRIKVHGKYLLIRGNRLKNQYQPVGGVYQYLSDATTLFVNINFKPDNIIPYNENDKNDLRIRIKGKDVGKFLKWFDSNKDRELSPWREFTEELITTEILSKNNFPYIFYNYLGRKSTPVRYVDFVGGFEIIIADIYELVTDEVQTKELEELYKQKSDKFIFAEEDLIRRLGVIPREEFEGHIAPTAKWIL